MNNLESMCAEHRRSNNQIDSCNGYIGYFQSNKNNIVERMVAFVEVVAQNFPELMK
jgi:hypothetical protein